MVKKVCFASLYSVEALDALLLLIEEISLVAVGVIHLARLADDTFGK